MATNAVRWALYESPADDYRDVVILAALGDHASHNGDVGISAGVVAKRLGMPAADVNESIRRLRQAGLVRLDGHGKVAGLNLDGRRTA